MRRTLKTRWGSDEVSVTADWAQAACPVDGGLGQVADYGHSARSALEAALRACARAEGLDPEDDETVAAIKECMSAAWEGE